MKKTHQKTVRRAITTSAIIAGGLSIPAFHNDAHADELNNNENSQVTNQNQNLNENSNTNETAPQENKSIEDVSNQVSAENETTTQPENTTSEKTNVTPVEAPKEETQEVAPKEQSTETNEVEQPKEETREVAPKEETTESTQTVEQPKEETQEVAPKEETQEVAPKEETQEVAPKEETQEVAPKEETTESNETVEQLKEETQEVAPKEETTESNETVEQPKEETTESNETIEQPKEETQEVAPKEETTEPNEVEQSKEENTESNEVEQSKKETAESNEVEQSKEETAESNEVEQSKEETTESNEVEQSKEESTESNEVEQSKEETNTVKPADTEAVKSSTPDADDTQQRDINDELDAGENVTNTNTDTLNNINVSPFAIDLENPNTPSDSPDDKARIVSLSQPVTSPRNNEEKQVSDNAGNEDVQITNILSEDKYNITNLTGKFQKGDNQKYDTYNTHMEITLDDSVKDGDKIVYGIKYNFKDLNNTYPTWLASVYSDSPKTKDIVLEDGTVVGKMTMQPPINSESTNDTFLARSEGDFSLDSLDGTSSTFYYYRSIPVIVEFNENINNLKNTRISLDNTFVVPEEKYMNPVNSTYMYVDPDSDSNDIVRNQDGTFVKLTNAFEVNNKVQNLDVLLPVKEKKDEPSINNLEESNIRYNLLERVYQIRTSDGKEFIKSDDPRSIVYVDTDKHPTSKVVTTVTVPKAVADKMNYEIISEDYKNSATYPTLADKRGASKYNPIVGVDGVYTNYNERAFNTSDAKDYWTRTTDQTTNDNGDTVYTVTFTSKDGKPHELSSEGFAVLIGTPKDNMQSSEFEPYEKASAREKYDQWGYDELDSLLKNNPLDVEIVTTHDDGEDTVNRKYENIGYSVRKENVKEAGEGFVSIDADRPQPEQPEPELPQTGVDKSTDTEPIPFKTEYRDNPDLKAGETRVIQEGEDGEYTIYYETPTLNGEPNGERKEVDRQQTKDPVNKIVERGTGVVDVDRQEKEEPIDFETIERENPNLPSGETRIIQEGKDGKVKVVTETPTLNDKPNGDTKEVDRRIIEHPVDRIVEVGTGVVGTDVEEINRELPFNTIERVNPELPQGTRNVVQEGKVGNERTSITYETLNGEHTSVKDTQIVVTDEPQDRIVEIGSGVEGKNVTIVESVQPFEKITRENPDLPEGMQRIVQDGVDGIERTTTVDKTFNGEVTDTVKTSETVQEKVDQIIEIGTGKVGFKTEDIPNTTKHKVIKRENPDLPKGERRVIQEGHDGHTIKRIVTPTLNGEPNGKSEVVVITIDEPQDTIIEIGTGEEKEVVPPTDNTPKEEQPKEEQPQYPTPDHSHDHDGIHDNTPVEAKQQPVVEKTTQPVLEKEQKHVDATPHAVVTHDDTNNAVTVEHVAPRQNITLSEQPDGSMVVQVVKPATQSTKQAEQVVDNSTPQVAKNTTNDEKELPQTGGEDNSKQAGILASILGAVGLGFLARRKKETDK